MVRSSRDFLSVGLQMLDQDRLRVFAVAAELERSEVLVACGSDLTQACRRWTPRPEAENLIFGNRVLPKNRANQVLSRRLFFRRLLFLEEIAVCGVEVLFRVLLG